MIFITEHTLPKLYHLIRLISFDNGIPIRERYYFPFDQEKLADFETAISDLTPLQMEILAFGEESETLAIVMQYGLEDIHNFLNKVFEHI